MNEEKLKRDSHSNAVLNIDSDGLTAYKIKRKKQQEFENDINNLKEDIFQIKQMLKEIINK